MMLAGKSVVEFRVVDTNGSHPRDEAEEFREVAQSSF